jgi:hypothetical protein
MLAPSARKCKRSAKILKMLLSCSPLRFITNYNDEKFKLLKIRIWFCNFANILQIYKSYIDPYPCF